mgnify:CR=1 FL=1
MKHLYIIGNGFDRHHKMECGFDNYAEWLKKTNPDIYYKVENAYGIQNEDLWCDFEHLLGMLDVQEHAERIAYDRYPTQKQLENSTDKEFDNLKRWYELSPDEAREEFEDLFEDIRSSFREWVEQLNAPNIACKIPIEKEGSFFVTFNYTDTPETLYRIAEENILYIHGKAKRGDELVLGHGLTLEEIRMRNTIEPPEDADTQEKIEAFYRNQGDVIIDETFDEVCGQLLRMQKPIPELIQRMRRRLSTIEEVEMIHIYGFSFSDIDLPYLGEIISMINLKTTHWEVSYYKPDEETKFRRILCEMGVPDSQVETKTLEAIKMYSGCKALF